MCSCFGPGLVLGNEPNRGEEMQEERTISFSISPQLRDITVRIVHAGGRIEMYHNAVRASTLIRKYPGMCIARPEVFKRPLESVLSDGDILLPGNKYYVIALSAVEKLKRRHTRKWRKNEHAVSDNEPGLKAREIDGIRDHQFGDQSVCTSGDFFVPKETWSNFVTEKRVKTKGQFVPPIQKPRMWKECEWEPSLNSIQEVSL